MSKYDEDLGNLRWGDPDNVPVLSAYDYSINGGQMNGQTISHAPAAGSVGSGPPSPVVETIYDDTLPQTNTGLTGSTTTGTAKVDAEDATEFDVSTVLIGAAIVIGALWLLKK